MNIVRSWGVENLAQSTELFAKQQVRQHCVNVLFISNIL